MRTTRWAFLASLICLAPASLSQVKNPVKWTYTATKTGPGRFTVNMKAVLEKGWHLYSQQTPDGGPIPTQVSFTKNPLVTLSGPVKEIGKLETVFEKLFDVNVKQYSNEVTFLQNVTVKGNVKTNLAGTIEYMLCNEKECLPPRKNPFTVALQ
jgi:thiol:disulfide interchange protein DsbD